ncbi:MAG: hypothetical protein WED33_04650 [Bacteroidia bacterium]
MNEALFSLKDFILMPVYLLIIFYVANQIKNNNIEQNPLYKFYTRGLFLKLLGGIMVCLIYVFYYGGGDTIGFYKSARLLARLSFVNQETFFSVLGGNLSNLNLMRFIENDLCCPDYYRDPQSFMVVRMAAPFVLFSGISFFGTTLIFAWLSYAGIWRLFLLFNELYPGMEKKFAISILYMPSVLFWGSAILKDTITFSAACWVTVCVYYVFIKNKQRTRYFIYLFLSSFILVSIKPYIFVALLPGATIWILYTRITSIQSGFFRLLISPAIIAIGLFGSSAILTALGSRLGSFASVDTAIDKAIVTKNDLTRDAYGENSFDIGEIDGSIGSIVSKFPVALTAGLFRPFLWDVTNPVMLLSAFENTLMLLLTIRILLSFGPFRFFSEISKEPLLIFSFVFVVFFSFSVGLTTANFGALVRYKIPSIPFFMSLLMILDQRRAENKVAFKVNDEDLNPKTVDGPITQ